MSSHLQTALPPAPIALVEDEPVLRDELVFQLQHRGFNVLGLGDAAALYRHLATQAVAIVVLDIGLPGENGISVAQYLRGHYPHMGLVFVTARTTRQERLEGLGAGADAYLTKPVDLDELDLLLQRLLQRHAHIVAATPPASSRASALGQPRPTALAPLWMLDSHSATLLAPGGGKVRLTLTELQLLTALIHAQGRPCQHIELARAMGLMPDEWDRHRLEVIVSRLRNKVERETGHPAPLRTVRGAGYAWDVNKQG